MTAAGYASADDPLLDRADAWAYVCSEVAQALAVPDQWEGQADAQTALTMQETGARVRRVAHGVGRVAAPAEDQCPGDHGNSDGWERRRAAPRCASCASSPPWHTARGTCGRADGAACHLPYAMSTAAGHAERTKYAEHTGDAHVA